MMFGGWILIGLVLYLVYRNKGLNFTQNTAAMDRLTERFINGEIDQETYLKIKKVIRD
jgi:uncharacterized membrane protein